jgi:hypothetical protein
MSRVKGFRILKLLLIFFHLISLWWRRAVLPRRPVQFSVCFIKLYYIYTTSNINCQVLFWFILYKIHDHQSWLL